MGARHGQRAGSAEPPQLAGAREIGVLQDDHNRQSVAGILLQHATQRV
jgi:hypothetical protein